MCLFALRPAARHLEGLDSSASLAIVSVARCCYSNDLNDSARGAPVAAGRPGALVGPLTGPTGRRRPGRGALYLIGATTGGAGLARASRGTGAPRSCAPNGQKLRWPVIILQFLGRRARKNSAQRRQIVCI